MVEHDRIGATFWRNVRAPTGGEWKELVLSALAERVRQPKPPADPTEKLENPVWAFARFREGHRNAGDFEYAVALHLDFDSNPAEPGGSPRRGNPDLTYSDLLRAIGDLRHLAHTTWRHGPGAARWRVILPLSRAVDAIDYGRLADVALARAGQAGVFGLDADRTWREPSRAFVVPVHREGYEGYANGEEVPRLDVDAWLREADERERDAERVTWEEPTPLSAAYCATPFPVDALPSPLARVVDALAASLQVPPDLVALPALGLLSGAVAGKARVEVKPDWHEPLVLWTCVAARPGARKSPALNALRAPFDGYEEEARKAVKAARTTALHRQEELKRQAKKAEDSAARDRIAADLARLEVPPRPTLLVDDSTPEALARIMQENGGRATIASAEAVTFQHLCGLYSAGGRGANLDLYLKGWGGERVSVHRRGGEPVDIAAALLSMALAVQPDAVAEVARRPELGGRGVLQRFLWGLPRDRVGYREIDAPALPREASDLWQAMAGRMLRLPVGPRVAPLCLDADALGSFSAYRTWHEPQLQPGGAFDDPPAYLEWQSKAPGTVARIAGLLALVGWASAECFDADAVSRGEVVVDGSVMDGAIRLIAYFGDHARHALTAAGLDPGERLASRLLGCLDRRPEVATFTSREAHGWLNASGLDARKVEAAVERLARHHYVRRVEPPPSSRQGGRPPAALWAVNPRWERTPRATTGPYESYVSLPPG